MLAQHRDPTVDQVLKTWAPRMIVQGIDYNDFMTTSSRIRVWDDWCREWCATAAGHEEFALPLEALNCFAFGLSAACRLCVVYRGAMPTKWIVEAQRDGTWVADSETGLILIPFWLPRRVVYLQNCRVIEGPPMFQ